MQGTSYRDVQNKLLNRFIVVMSCMSVPAALISMRRIGFGEWQSSIAVHGVAVIIAILLAVYRERVPRNVKAVGAVGTFMGLAVYSFLMYGLSASGVEILMLCVLSGVVFIGRRFAIGIHLTGSTILIVMGLLVTRGVITPMVDVSEYNLDPASWMNAVSFFTLLMGLGVLIVGSFGLELRTRIEVLDRTNTELTTALDELRTLKSVVPMCAGCRKVRNAEGGWDSIESYLKVSAGSDVSHGICPDCEQELYPELSD